MTYAQLFAAVHALVGERTFNVEVSTWRHVGRGVAVVTEWTISVSDRENDGGYRAAAYSPEDALAALRTALEVRADQLPSDEQAVGEVQP